MSGDWISPKEVAEQMGMKDPETIRAALRGGTFPVGWAAHIPGGKWKYMIPRAPGEYFMKTGRVPDVGEPVTLKLDGEEESDAKILRAAAAIYSRMADKLEGVSA